MYPQKIGKMKQDEMGKVWRRRWVDDDFRWVTWRSRFFSIFKKVWGTNPLTTLSGQLWALDPCRPEGTEGVHAFKTQLLRAKREGSNLNHSVCLFIEETRAFAAFASTVLLTKWHLDWKHVVDWAAWVTVLVHVMSTGNLRALGLHSSIGRPF